MRRKKKLFTTLLIISIIIIVLIFCYFFFIKPLISLIGKNKSNNSSDENSNHGELINITTITEPNVDIKLPEQIKQISTTNSTNTSGNTSNETSEVIVTDKKYTPIIESPERYLITKLSNNKVTILIGEDSSKLLNNTSKTQIGLEYTVSGIAETIISEYYFTIDGYDYPIVLLLGKSRKLYYVDTETAYQTGNFVVNGYIQNIPEVENVYATTVEHNGTQYRSAVISCINGEGYEFNIDMIGR